MQVNSAIREVNVHSIPEESTRLISRLEFEECGNLADIESVNRYAND